MTTRSASIPNASWAGPNGIQRHLHSVLVEGERISDYRIQLDVLCRVCPGKELALNSLFIVMATVIATLDISKAKDDHGHEIEPQCDYTPSMVRYVFQYMLPVIAISFVIFYSHPLPFETCITPRSEKAIALIRDALEERGLAA